MKKKAPHDKYESFYVSVPPHNSKNRTIKQERGQKTDTNCWWTKKKTNIRRSQITSFYYAC